MPVIGTELKMYKSATVSDTTANGGRMGTTLVSSGVKNNIFPDVPESERTAGSTKYRKVFLKVEDSENLALQNPQIFMSQFTAATDRVIFFAGTQTNTQNEITGSERKYGAGQLAADRSSGQTSLTVNVEDAADAIFQNGDFIWISNGTIEQKLEVQTVSWNSNQATLTLASGNTLGGTYLATNTYVASMYQPSDVQTSFDTWGEVGTGTYDETTYPPVLSNVGTVEDTWTLTFTSATNFSVSGANSGLVGTGTVSSSFAPNNPSMSAPYFTLNTLGWGGTWTSGNTVSFKTHPAAVPIWLRRTVPASAASLSLNTFKIRFDGASA
jgi:hypothetical protein